jgi:hypothetical protein
VLNHRSKNNMGRRSGIGDGVGMGIATIKSVLNRLIAIERAAEPEPCRSKSTTTS